MMRKPHPIEPWPPIIILSDIPLWVRFRDGALALIGWLILQDLLYDFWVLMYDWLKYPIFILAPEDSPDWVAILDKLRPFLIGGGVVVAGIVLTAISRRRLIAMSLHATERQPPTYIGDFHSMQVSNETHDTLQGLRSADVHVDAAGDIAQVGARGAPVDQRSSNPTNAQCAIT